MGARAMTLREMRTTARQSKLAMTGMFLAVGVAAAVGLKKVSDEFVEAHNIIQRETGATGKELDGLKDSFNEAFKRTPADAEQTATAIGQVNTRLKLTGRELEDRAVQFLNLSKITGEDLESAIRGVSRAFVDWEVDTKDQASVMDGFLRLSQKTGVTVSDLSSDIQKFGSPLRQLGFTLEEAAAMFAQFELAGVNSQTMVPGFKLAIGNILKPTEDLRQGMAGLGVDIDQGPRKVLRDFMAVLSETGNMAEKKSLALDLFGKRAGADMVEAIQQGRFELDDLVAVFRHGKGTINETAESTRTLDDRMTMLGQRGLLALQRPAMAVTIGLTAIVNGAIAASDAIAGLPTPITTTIGVAAGLGAGLLVLGLTISGITRVAASARAGLTALYATMARHPLGLLALGVGVAVGALVSLVGGSDDAADSQQRLTETADRAADAFDRQREAMQRLRDFSLNLGEARLRERAATLGVERAEQTYRETVQRSGRNSLEAREASLALARARLEKRNASREAGRVEKSLGGITGEARVETLKSIAAERSRIGVLGQERSRLLESLRAERRRHGNSKRAVEIEGELLDVERQLRNARGRLNAATRNGNSILDIWARNMARANPPTESLHQVLKRFARDGIPRLNRETRGQGREVTGLQRKYEQMFPTLEQVIRRTGRQGREVRKLGRTYGDTADVTDRAIGRIARRTNRALGALDVKKLNFGLGAPGNQRGGEVVRALAQGGLAAVVPGEGAGDRHLLSLNGVPIAKVESREGIFVGNRELMAEAAAANEQFPRFPGLQRGGMIHPPGTPGTAVVNAAIATQVAAWLRRYRMTLTQGYNPGGPSVSPGHLVTGTALDTVPSAGWGGGPTRVFEQGLRAALAAGKQVLYGSHGVGTPWPNHGFGNHAHTEWGMGGAVAGMVNEIKRVLITGPPGAHRDMAQAAADEVRKAANRYLSEQMVGLPVGAHVDAGGPIADIARRMVVDRWGSGQWSPFLELKRRESGPNWDPTITNPTSGAGGIPQALPPSKMGSPAWPPTQGRRSIIAQLNWMIDYIGDRYGTPSSALSFHDANNWYQRGGFVDLWGTGLAQLAGGGEAKKKKPVPKALRQVRAMRRMMTRSLSRVGSQDERIDIAERLASLESSPAGADLSGGERGRQVSLQKDLLRMLRRTRQIARRGLTRSTRGIKGAKKPALKQSLRDLRREFADSLVEMQGMTGRGGRIFDTQLALAELGSSAGAGTAEGRDPMRIDELVRFAEAVRFGAFDPQLTAHQGGIIGGTGEVLAKLKAGEGVIDRDTMERGIGGRYELTITNWREGRGYLEEVADDRIDEHERADSLRDRAGA